MTEQLNLPAPQGDPVAGPAIAMRGLGKRFGDVVAVKGIDLDVPRGAFFGLVGPNGAGKTTTLSMATGLLRPDSGRVLVLGHDVWSDPVAAKQLIGILPDGLRTFDRLTGLQLIVYAGLLHGLSREVAQARADELLKALGLTDAQGKLVVDYSAGMTKKVTLATALIHAPRVLVLDEPFEAVDPVSAATIRGILTDVVAAGGTVVLSSHVMDLVERICSHVAVISDGLVLAQGTVDEVRSGSSLEERFVDLVGGSTEVEGLAWLRTSSE
ncbi:ABC transporter ATP-binding protein [Intrasporangium calvum]|uniref:ABC transporter ATP-binding protein n=1 Tax=Intrasporangium calvum TaxID=53358 RepID=UPI000DF6137A|nr:ABC transporter ATP-binding protein [Intrasporangium calvum]AXG13562.1 ABC transporter ATP-binding protein [Intrasporangium calvum]